MLKFYGMLIVFALTMVNMSGAVEVKLSEVPEAVQESIKNELADEFELDQINKVTRDGQTVYEVEGDNRFMIDLEMVIAEDGTVLDRFEEGQFRVIDNQLYVEDSRYRIRTVYTPEAGKPAEDFGPFLQAISDTSRVGCRGLAFDLFGFNEDGTALSHGAQDLLNEMVYRGTYANIELICRLLAGDAPQDKAGRINAVKTAAQFMKNKEQFLVWIDGPDAEELVQVFKELAPRLVVAGPGGDVQITSDETQAINDQTTIIFGDPPKNAVHFILSNTDESYQWLDERNTPAIEKEPWQPEKSILSEEERAEGYISLFDGKTLNGWYITGGNKRGFAVVDNTIEWQSRGAGALQSLDRYDDFILKFDYKIERNGNSGVQVRCPRSNRASKIGFEFQILGDHGRPPSPSSTGSVYAVVAPTINASKPAMEWNSVELMCHGPHVKAILNGEVVQDINFDDYPELKYRLRDGFIRLTDHGNYVAYKNIRIKKLD